MPVSEFHRQVAAIALAAAGRHGFALAGGNALMAHGIIDRPTEDIIMRSVELSTLELSQPEDVSTVVSDQASTMMGAACDTWTHLSTVYSTGEQLGGILWLWPPRNPRCHLPPEPLRQIKDSRRLDYEATLRVAATGLTGGRHSYAVPARRT